MRITDIIRGVLDIVDAGNQPEQPQPDAIAALAVEPEEATPALRSVGVSPNGIIASPEPEVDLLAVIQHLAGVETSEPTYANEPCEMTAPIGASFPGGDDVHSRKNPADIRTDAPSMYPGYQAEKR